METFAFIIQSIKDDPRLRLAGGVALLGAVVAAVLSFTGGDHELAVIGGLFVVGFMVLLTIFVSISESKRKRPHLESFLIWSISLAFVASIALIVSSYFFCIPQGFGRSCSVRLGYVRGDIVNVPAPHKKTIGIALEGYAMGVFHEATKAFHFVVLENRSEREMLTVTVRPPGNASDLLEDIKVHLSCITPSLRAQKVVEWRYLEEDRPQPDGSMVKTPTLYEKNRKIGEFGLLDAILCERSGSSAERVANWRDFLPGMAALAQVPTSQPLTEVRAAIQNLTDEDANVRRSARTMLANGSVEAVPSILQAMRDQPGDYRVQLGGSVALTEMLRRNKADADRIAKVLNGDADRLLLLKAAGDRDRTLRIYASEFLYDLGDPQVSRQAIALASRADDENARYNWLLVAQGGWHKLSPVQKQEAGADLVRARDASGPQTLKLFEKLK